MPTLMHAAHTRKVITYGKKRRTRVVAVAVDLSDDEVAEALGVSSPVRPAAPDKENVAPVATKVRKDVAPLSLVGSPLSSKTSSTTAFRVISPARRRRRGHLLPLPLAAPSPKRPALSARSSNTSIYESTSEAEDAKGKGKGKAARPVDEVTAAPPRAVQNLAVSVSSTSSVDVAPRAPAARLRGVPAKRAKAKAPVIAISSDSEVEPPPERTTTPALVKQTRAAKSSSEASVPDEEATPTPASPQLSNRLRAIRLGSSTDKPPPALSVAPEAGLRRSTRVTSNPSTSSAPAAPPSSVPGPPPPQPFTAILDACGQSEPISFDSFVDQVGQLLKMTGSTTTKPRWTKLAEASFSEVFAVSTSPQKRPALADIVVVKVVPLRGEPIYNGQGELVELPQETEAEEAERELAITKLLGESGNGFIRLHGAFVATGAYPAKLLAPWDAYAEKRAKDDKHDPSECNPRPDIFPATQRYLLLCLPHCGTDLEHFRLGSWTEATSILWQVALALAKAERAHSFEHRDLHWGNVIIQRLPADAVTLALAKSHGIPPTQALAALSLAQPVEWPLRLNASRTGVLATIIDHTLSRADDGRGRTLFNPFDSEDLFMGEGDLQFDLYRHMRQIVGEDWSTYHPVTNVTWLLYIATKLVDCKSLTTPSLSGHITAASTPRRGLQTPRDQALTRAIAHAESEAYGSLVGAKYALRGQVDRILKSAKRRAGEAATWQSAHDFVAWFASAPKRQ